MYYRKASSRCTHLATALPPPLLLLAPSHLSNAVVLVAAALVTLKLQQRIIPVIFIERK